MAVLRPFSQKSLSLCWLCCFLGLAACLIFSATARAEKPAGLEKAATELAEKLVTCPLAISFVIREERLKVLQQPLLKKPGQYVTPFSEYLMEMITERLVCGNNFQLVRPTADHCTFEELRHRTRGKTRGSGGMNKAHAILEGNYFVTPKEVRVSLWIRDDEGEIFARATEHLDKKHISLPLEDAGKQTLATRLDQPQDAGAALDGLKLFCGKGEGEQHYTEGETIRLFVQNKSNKPLYITLYNLAPDGQAHLLYPWPEDGLVPLQPKELYIIPKNEQEDEIVIEPPFGLEGFKVFGATAPLPQPVLDRNKPAYGLVKGVRSARRRKKAQKQLVHQSVIHPADLADWYRVKARQQRTPLYEASLFVQSRAK